MANSLLINQLEEYLCPLYRAPNSLAQMREIHKFMANPKGEKSLLDAIGKEELARCSFKKYARSGKRIVEQNIISLDKVERGKVRNFGKMEEPSQIGKLKPKYSCPQDFVPKEFFENWEKFLKRKADGVLNFRGKNSGGEKKPNRRGGKALKRAEAVPMEDGMEGAGEEAGLNPQNGEMPEEIGTFQRFIHSEGTPGWQTDESVTEWRKRFEQMMAKKLANSNRIRFIFSREMYKDYVEKVRQIKRMVRNYSREMHLIKKFDLDESEQILLDRSNGRPYLCYEDIFDAIHNCQKQTPSDQSQPRINIFWRLKKHYANITMECVSLYFKTSNKPKLRNETEMIRKYSKNSVPTILNSSQKRDNSILGGSDEYDMEEEQGCLMDEELDVDVEEIGIGMDGIGKLPTDYTDKRNLNEIQFY